jgi:hypothetical protein
MMVNTVPLVGTSLALLAAMTVAKEMPVNELLAQEKYDSGIVHQGLMARKMVRIPQITRRYISLLIST